MLEDLGLQVSDELAYRQLLALGTCRIDEVAAVLDVTGRKALAVLEVLSSSGMVELADGVATAVPLTSVKALVENATERRVAERERTSELESRRLRARIEAAVERARVHEHMPEFPECQAVDRELYGAQLSSTEEILSLKAVDHRMPAAADQGRRPVHTHLTVGAHKATEYALRGPDYRSKSAQDIFSCCAHPGRAFRWSTVIPMRLEIFDRTIAFLPVNADDLSRGAFVVRSPELIQLLRRIFVDVWFSATPFRKVSVTSARPLISDTQLKVLGQLAQGHTDDRIARTLNMSRSTVARAVRELQDASLARSRFQLALHATREGWLDAETMVAPQRGDGVEGLATV
jgi:predicted transcriptional regulator